VAAAAGAALGASWFSTASVGAVDFACPDWTPEAGRCSWPAPLRLNPFGFRLPTEPGQVVGAIVVGLAAMVIVAAVWSGVVRRRAASGAFASVVSAD
jgi:hypothetical protein